MLHALLGDIDNVRKGKNEYALQNATRARKVNTLDEGKKNTPAEA